jgi:hypothetical protein
MLKPVKDGFRFHFQPPMDLYAGDTRRTLVPGTDLPLLTV